MMNLKQVADIKAHAKDGFGPATVVKLCDDIERLHALIQSMHQHYNPGADPFDIEAALAALP